jgi:hypothetical protein
MLPNNGNTLFADPMAQPAHKGFEMFWEFIFADKYSPNWMQLAHKGLVKSLKANFDVFQLICHHFK